MSKPPRPPSSPNSKAPNPAFEPNPEIAPVEFELHYPATGDELRANVEHALSLGLPDLARRGGRLERIHIVANGPSASGYVANGPTMALNGSVKLFGVGRSAGLWPSYYACLDPQGLVADFLADCPPETTYLIASKCHADVFKALKGRHVELFHVAEHSYWDLVEDRDPVMTCPTITLTAFELCERLGFRRFQTWGWDGCYLNGRDHAAPQAEDIEVVQNWVGEQCFATRVAWMHEAMQANIVFEHFPRDVCIHGGGMIKAILEAAERPLADAEPFAAPKLRIGSAH